MTYNELFANEFDTQLVRKKLAKAIGLNEAIVLNQLHYWIEKNRRKGKNHYDNSYWVYNTYDEWQQQDFEYWSVDTVKRTFTKLEKLGLVISGNYNKMPMDRTKWYTIDYEKLEEIAINIEKSTIRAKCPDGKRQNAPSNNHRIKQENKHYSSTELKACDFDNGIIAKIKSLTSETVLIDCVVGYLRKYKEVKGINHPDISMACLSDFLETADYLFDGYYDDLKADDGFEKMIDRHFACRYKQKIDYKFQHFASSKILEYQARYFGYIDGYKE